MGTLVIKRTDTGAQLASESRTSLPTISYNGSQIQSGFTGTKTCNTKDYMMASNLVIGGKTLNCKDMMMPYNVSATYTKSLVSGTATTHQNLIIKKRGNLPGCARYRGGGTIDSNYTLSALPPTTSHSGEAVGRYCDFSNAYVAISIGGRNYDAEEEYKTVTIGNSNATVTTCTMTYSHIDGAAIGVGNGVMVCGGHVGWRIASGTKWCEWCKTDGSHTHVRDFPCTRTYPASMMSCKIGSYSMMGGATEWSGDSGGGATTMYYWNSSGTLSQCSDVSRYNGNALAIGSNSSYAFFVFISEGSGGGTYNLEQVTVDRFTTSLTRTVQTFSVSKLNTAYRGYSITGSQGDVGDAYDDGIYIATMNYALTGLVQFSISNTLTKTDHSLSLQVPYDYDYGVSKVVDNLLSFGSYQGSSTPKQYVPIRYT